MQSWIRHWYGDWHGLKVQIVLRLYESPAEILLGFDCDCCCCLYDGRSVWMTPRCLRALETGDNILNSLHAWPNKPFYELRLAKYAYRGFPVLVPGLDTKRIDFDEICGSNLRELKGMARLLKIALEMDQSPREYATRQQGRIVTEFAPSPPLFTDRLLSHARDDLRDVDFTTRGMGSGYTDGFQRGEMIVLEVYGPELRSDHWWCSIGFHHIDIPVAANSLCSSSMG